jgi:hypothetical protein
MRRRQPITSRVKRHATRTVLAALLVFATLVSAVPPDAVFASVCCEGMGGAMKDSCPFMRLKALLQKQLAQSGSSCHAGMEMPSAGEAAHDEHGATPELFPANEGDGAERAADQNGSTQHATAQDAAPHAAASKPCRSECCCPSNSLARNQRPRGEAAILNKFRPPTSAASRRVALSVLKDDSAVRRLGPARAPPASL